MSRLRGVVIALLAAAAVAAANLASAQARGPSTVRKPISLEVSEDRRIRRALEMDIWLRRLEGKFRYEGFSYSLFSGDSPPPDAVAGWGECVGVGVGPGMQCAGNVPVPAVRLYGIDAVASKIRYLQLEGRGLAEEGMGNLMGDTLTTRVRVPNTNAAPYQEREVRIYAPAHGKLIQMTISIELNRWPVHRMDLYLHRIPQDLEEEASTPSQESR